MELSKGKIQKTGRKIAFTSFKDRAQRDGEDVGEQSLLVTKRSGEKPTDQ